MPPVGGLQGDDGLVKETLDVLAVQCFIIHQVRGDQTMIRGIHSGLRAARDHQQEGIQHRQSTGRQRQVNQADDQPDLR